MAVVWDDNSIFKLIELFETKPILWNCSTTDYKNKIKKNDAWEIISKDLDIPKKDVESKMHILRSQFAREKKKMTSSKTTGVGTADIEKSKWKFYDSLKFLLSTIPSSGGSDTINKKANHEDLETEQSSELNTASTPPTAASSSSQPQSMLPPTSCQKITKRKIDDNLNEMFEIVKTAKLKMDESKDEFDFYGQYVASELRAVKNENAVIQAKSYINNILIEMRMGKYNYSYGYQSNHGYESVSTQTSSASQAFENIEEIVAQIESVPESDTSNQ